MIEIPTPKILGAWTKHCMHKTSSALLNADVPRSSVQGARMSDVSFIERTKLEKLFQMGGGYVLDFSNRTLAEFVADSTGRDIYHSKYDYASGSKANRLRAFWTQEANHITGKLLTDLLEYCRPAVGSLIGISSSRIVSVSQPVFCKVRRLMHSGHRAGSRRAWLRNSGKRLYAAPSRRTSPRRVWTG